MAKRSKASAQELKAVQLKEAPAPRLSFGPAVVRRKKTPIGLIGCGGISETHLRAYRLAGFNVVALCDLIEDRAQKRREQFFPQAEVYTDHRQLLKREDIQVVDIATHPKDREYLIPAALKARKHVLSQKPFVMDLDKGRKFDALAKKMGVKLAINQNGRWAPYFSWMRAAVNKGLIGQPIATHMACHWDHQWIASTHFNQVHHIILYDFAIHWFDMLHCLMGDRKARRVTASLTCAPNQKAKPPLLGQAMVEYDHGQATLTFDATTPLRPLETDVVIGTEGWIEASGAVCAANDIRLTTRKGIARPDVSAGEWFVTGFIGSMSELLSAVEQNREPLNNPLNNLDSLAICFAAVASAESGKPVEVGKIKTVPIERCSVQAAQ